MGKYFGTDGFRGKAGITLTADHAYKVGRFLGWYYNALRERNGNNEPARIIIGKDTRRSSYMYVRVQSGRRPDCFRRGRLPAARHYYAVCSLYCPRGRLRLRHHDLCASHNPYYDNGIKLIDCYGEKMPEEILLLVEDYIDGKLHVFDKDWPELPFAHREHIGCTVDYVSGRNRYMGYLISLGIYSFKGVKVGLDCANGASWNIAKSVFDALGADIYVINAQPTVRISTTMQVPPTSRACRSSWLKRAWTSVLPTMAMLTVACVWMKRAMSSPATTSCTSTAAT